MIAAGASLLVVPMAMPGASKGGPARAMSTSPRQLLVAARLPSTPVRHHVAAPTRVVHPAVAAHSRVVHQEPVAHVAVRRPVVHYVAPVHHVVVRPVVRRPVVRRPVVRRPVFHPVAVLHPPVHPSGHRYGVATWYSWHVGQCASSYRPMGSRIYVRNLATGKTISCIVTDHQPYSPYRVVDLNETQFAQLAPLWRGVVRVIVTW